MSSIDDRVVRMEFDNKQFESGVQTTMTTLEKLNEALKFRSAASGFEEVQRASDSLSFAPINDGLMQVQQNFTFFGEFVRTIFDRISNRIIDLGSTITRELTTAPLRAGFSEYELQMDSTQTIMASTGKSIEEVSGYLDELNTYADKTIYSFSDMTQNIGKFTNAGVDLDVAVKAIQGISNEAAVSGANAQEASRAMYNFAQALSAGYVKLIDWKSIENANMATVEFKEQLLETAAELGTVEKTADGMYRVLGKNANGGTMSEAIDATHLFNDSLAYQWMTTDVLTQTLGKYADETTEIGKKAFAAATEVKTFSQLIDTLKESLGSGWTKSFQYIFGNLEEAKVLWTGVNNEIESILGPIAEAREALLKFWHDNGGRDTAIKAVFDAWQGVKAVMGEVSDAFGAIFPPMTGERLVEITNKIGELASNFKDFATSSEFLTRVNGIFSGFLTVVKAVAGAAGAALKTLSPLLDIFSDFGWAVFDAAYRLSLFVKDAINADDPLKFIQWSISRLTGVVREVIGGIEDLVQAFLDFVGIHIEGNPIVDIFDKLAQFASNHFDFSFLDVLAAAGKGVADVFGSLGGVISGVLNAILDFASGGFGAVVDILNGFADGAKGASDAAKNIGKSFDGLGVAKGILEGFGHVVSTIGDKIVKFVSWIGDNLPKIFEFLGSQELHNVIANFASLMGGKLLMSLSKFVDLLSSSKLAKINKASENGGIAGVIKSLFGDVTEKATGALDALTDALSSFQDTIKSSSLLKIAVALGILAASMAVLASIDSDKMAGAISGIAVAMGVLLGSFKILESGSGPVAASGLSKLAGSLIKMAIAVGILSVAMKVLSKLDMDGIIRGLVGIAGVMGTMVIAVSALSNFGGSIEKSAKGMVTFAIAIGLLTFAVKSMASLSFDEIIRGLVGVGILMAEVVAFSRLVDSSSLTIKAAASVAVLAVALRILASSVSTFARLQWESLARGLTGVGILLAEISAFSRAFSKDSSSLRAAITILAIAASVKILEGTVSVFAGLDGLGRGLAGVAGLLASVAIFAAIVGRNSLTMSSVVSVLVLTEAIKSLSEVVTSLGGMSWSELSAGLVGLAGSVAVMVVALRLLSKGAGSMLVGAAALTVMAVALRIFLPVFQTLSGMDIGQIVKGFVTLGAAIAVLAVGALALSAVAPAMFLASAAIGALGIACTLFGIGIGVASAGIIALAAAITTAAASIVANAAVISSGIIGLVEAIIVGIFKGIVHGIVVLVEGIAEILGALGTLVHAIGDFIVDNIPYILEVIGSVAISVLAFLPTFISPLCDVIAQFIVALVQTIVEWLPVIADTLISGVVMLINSVANGIRDNGEAILGAVGNLLSSVLELILTALGEIVKHIPVVGDMLAGYIESGKESVRNALAPESFAGMADEAVGATANGLASGSGELSAAASDTGAQAHDSFFSSFVGSEDISGQFIGPIVAGIQGHDGEFASAGDSGKESYLSSFIDGSADSAGTAISESVLSGITDSDDLFDAAGLSQADLYAQIIGERDASPEGETLSESGASGAGSNYSSWSGAGQSMAEGFGWGVASPYALSIARSAGAQLGSEALNSIRATIQSHSPSRATMKLGKYTSQGFAIGIKSLTGLVYNEASDVGNRALDGIRSSIGEMSKYLDEGIEYDPTIRPVMDLSDIQNGVSRLNRIVNGGVSNPLVGIGAYPQSILSAVGSNQAQADMRNLVHEFRGMRNDLADIASRPSIQMGDINATLNDDAAVMNLTREYITRLAALKGGM